MKSTSGRATLMRPLNWAPQPSSEVFLLVRRLRMYMLRTTPEARMWLSRQSPHDTCR